MDKQFAVIGMGRFGSSVAKTLRKLGYEVLAVDSSEDRIQEIAPFVTHAVVADATDEDALKELGLRNFDVVVVSIGQDIQASILCTVLLKDLGVKHLVVKALSELHGKVLERVGADRVIYPERDMGIRLANNLVSAGMLDYIELAPHYSIVEILAPEEFHGKTLGDLALRARFGVQIMAIKRDDEIKVGPGADDMIQPGDILVAMGDDRHLDKFQKA